jgi:ectoine hydroxylase-related dioxygenase (phytanoyl-CoA dioxygenase family)
MSSLRARFDVNGYAVVEDVISADGLRALREELDGVLRGIERDLGEPSEEPFAARLVRHYRLGRRFYREFDICLPREPFPADIPIHLGDGAFAALTSPSLLDVIEELIGPEIMASPVQHVRIKPPERIVDDPTAGSLLVSTGWHQDAGVVSVEADRSHVISAWIAISEATVENGCLEVIPGSHRYGLKEHCVSDVGLEIPERLLPGQGVAVPLSPGAAIVFHDRLIHGSLANVTADGVRISLDLRYVRTGLPNGRDFYPSFVVRSSADTGSVVTDAAVWRAEWLATRERLADRDLPPFDRWRAGSALCA